MDRSNLLMKSVCGILIACLVVLLRPLSLAQSTKPNVLFVIADQWRAEAFGFAGNRDVRTPALDALAMQSVRFTNAVATIPVCCPTRASLLTGRRALSHGVFMNDVPLNPTVDSIAKVFGSAGYDTGFIGKWHVDGHGRTAFIPQERRQGFRTFHALECTHEYNNSTYYADGPNKLQWPGYDAQAQTADAVKFITDRANRKTPFFLMLSWGPPHEPYQTAPENYRKLFDPAKLTLRPNVPTDRAVDARRDLAG